MDHQGKTVPSLHRVTIQVTVMAVSLKQTHEVDLTAFKKGVGQTSGILGKIIEISTSVRMPELKSCLGVLPPLHATIQTV